MGIGTSGKGLRIGLVAVELFVAVNALPAGAALAIRPDGGLLGMPLDLLARSPFRSFLVPGLLLALAVGGSAVTAAAALLRRHRRAPELGLVSAAILAGWLAVQAALIGFFWLQPVLLATAAAQATLAWLLRHA